MKRRKLAPWLALALVVVVAIVVLVVRSRPDNSSAARAARLEQQLACPVCEGQSVADSNSPQSRAIRADIPRRIAAGQSDAEIRQYYVSRYTERILETPSNSGLGIIAWGLPALAVILGALSIVVAVRRWSHAPRLEATDEDEDIVRRAREETEAAIPLVDDASAHEAHVDDGHVDIGHPDHEVPDGAPRADEAGA
jgi:cytochrome c-type biogenesis protein CcmH